MIIRCLSCHRRERLEEGHRLVESPGGSRRPTMHPELAAWRTLRAGRAGETDPVVDRCTACQQPMIGPGKAIPWTIHTPEGDVEVADALTGPKGPMTLDEADFWIEEQLRERLEIKPGLFLFQASVLSTMLVPLALWVFAVICFFTFVIRFGNGS